MAASTGGLSPSHWHRTYLPLNPRLVRTPSFAAGSLKRRLVGALPVVADSHGQSRALEVIAIGSRKDAVLDFCMSSRLLSSPHLRFSTIQPVDASKLQLIQRSRGSEVDIRYVEFPYCFQPCPSAVILVASAGHDFDYFSIMELLNSVKSAGGLVVSIFLKPFSFEGQRRQEESAGLVKKLHDYSNVQIVVEADSFLKTEVETLAEALESANNAVLLTVSMISIMVSGLHHLFYSPCDGQVMTVVSHEKVQEILAHFGEAKVVFGAGYNIKSAIKQAISLSPSLMKDSKSITSVVISLTSARIVDESDLITTVHTFRQVTGFTGEILLSGNFVSSIQPNLMIASLHVSGRNIATQSQQRGLLSHLVSSLPFISTFIRQAGQIHPTSEEALLGHSVGTGTESEFYLYGQEINESIDSSTKLPAEGDKWSFVRDFDRGNDKLENEIAEVHPEPCHEKNVHIIGGWLEETGNAGSGFHIAQLWAKERTTVKGICQIDEHYNFTLPVGVKPSEMQTHHLQSSQSTAKSATSNDSANRHSNAESTVGREPLAGMGLEVLKDIYDSTITLLNRRDPESRKRSLVAVRAESVLEAERQVHKVWAPVVEIQYKGGTYRGRCQEGVPEGKGRMIFPDGSFYDGMWRNGKRSGIGMMCYSNGDVFHGTWRDDYMHGKGWFYFQGGDRWFANFWKGKANGEGRFYSNDGNTFFGFFKKGWRHGECLQIDLEGSRWLDVWEEGVLISRKQIDSSD